jgi:prepilin-type N-terminal cleavage/methylation domain-containing protein/prepilin-type processing-associated H-X9-DG protein
MVRRYARRVPGERSSLGFTLVELLVVVAVITLLLAILLPVLSMVRQRAMRWNCAGNLKQIGVAWRLYLDTYDGRFYQGVNAQFTYGGWKGINFPDDKRPLNEFLSMPEKPESEAEARTFECPADNGITSRRLYRYDGTSYSTNIFLVGQDGIRSLLSTQRELTKEINKRLKNLNESRVASPSRLALVGDSPWGDQWLPTVVPSLSRYPRGAVWHGRCCHYNLAFLDGHVKFTKIRKGEYVANDYTVIPFEELRESAKGVQVPEPCPVCD